MEKFNRAERRAQRERLKAKRRNYWGGDRVLTPTQLGILLRTTTPCACWMCVNPRRDGVTDHRLTIQERRLFQRLLQED